MSGDLGGQFPRSSATNPFNKSCKYPKTLAQHLHNVMVRHPFASTLKQWTVL